MQFDFTMWQVAIVLLTYLFAAFAKGVSGLGFSTTCLPFLTFAVGLKDALPLLIIPSLASNIVVMHRAGYFRKTVCRFRWMLAATVPGLLIGLWVLNSVNGAEAAAILGVVLLAWCTFSFFKPNFHLPPNWEHRAGILSGFLTGTVNGITGSQVMPSLPYLMALQLDRPMFVQAMNCSFTLSSIIMALGLGKLGLFSSDVVVLSIIGVSFAFFGLKLGENYRNRLSAEAFRIVILSMLWLMGGSLIFRAFI